MRKFRRAMVFFLPRPGRGLMFLLSLSIVVVLLAVNKNSAHATPGQVTITNLRENTVFVAYGVMTPYSSKAGDLTVIVPRHITYHGWYRIEPGKSRDFPANSWIFVEQNGNRIWWPNRNETTGIVRYPNAFNNVSVNYDRYGVPLPDSSNISIWLGRGYVERTFQELQAGFYQITGDEYVVRRQKYDFDFGSHSFKWHNRCYAVPGTVVEYSVSASRKHGPNVNWTQQNEAMCLAVATQGHQPYITAATERGYYRGTITIYYTVPAR